jgi:hypothetical protein
MTFSLKGTAFMALLLFCFTVDYSQDVTVDFEGRVSNDNATLSESIVQVLQDGKLLTSFKTDQNGSYNIYLPLGSDYLISISKNDYVQKYFSVSTKGIPQDQAGVKLPAIRADVDLFKYYDGVDYSMFDEPISKFYYSSKKGNFEYDKEYLKAKKEEMKKVKLAEKRAIQLALQKNAAKQKSIEKSPEKKEDVAKLAEEKKVLDEKLAKQSLMLKLIEEEDKSLFKNKQDKNEVELNIVAANNDASEKVINKKINELVTKYKQGVTEEKQEGRGVIVIKRVVVREEEAWVYEKKIFDWGGVSYFRDKQRITASTFNIETAVVKK